MNLVPLIDLEPRREGEEIVYYSSFQEGVPGI